MRTVVVANWMMPLGIGLTKITEFMITAIIRLRMTEEGKPDDGKPFPVVDLGTYAEAQGITLSNLPDIGVCPTTTTTTRTNNHNR